MSAGALPVYPARGLAQAGPAASSGKAAVLFFFALVAVQLIIPALEALRVPGAGASGRIVQFVFACAAAAYLVAQAGFVLSELLGLACGLLFLSASFFATELFNHQRIGLAIFEAAKVLAPFVFLMVALALVRQQPESFLRAVKLVLAGCYAVSFAGILALPGELVHGRGLAPAAFGGMHTSAYIICLCGLCSHVLWRRGRLGTRVNAACLAASLVLIGVVWNVRTTALLFLVFFAVLHARWTWNAIVPLGIVLSGAALAYLFVVGASVPVDSLVTFSSGRLSMWGYKLDLLASADAMQLFFGKGVGSDFMLSEIWWWAAKDSHNDYLRVVTELGIVGLALVLLVIGAQHAALGTRNREATALTIGYLAASAFSNGLLFRPLPSLMFALAMAATLVHRPEGGGDATTP